MNIYQKLSDISNELKGVSKNLNVQMGKGSYKAVGEADVLAAVKPLEAKHKVYSYPLSRKIIESGTIESVDYSGKPKKQFFERIEVVYRFVNVEDPTEYVDMISYGDGIDSGDKSVGKAMTYADKYALLKAYKIQTGDDPDQNASEELKDTIVGPVSVSQREVEQGKATSVDKNTKQEVKAQKVDIIGILEIVNKKPIEDQDKFWSWLTDVYHTTKLEDLSFNQATELRAKLMKKEAKKNEIKEQI